MGLTYLQNAHWSPPANSKEKFPVRGLMGGGGGLHFGQGEENVIILKSAQSILLNKSLPFQGDHETLRRSKGNALS